MPPPPSLQTIHIESIPQAKKLAERLCYLGYYFTCQYSYPHPGRWFSFSEMVLDGSQYPLFRGIIYSRVPNEVRALTHVDH